MVSIILGQTPSEPRISFGLLIVCLLVISMAPAQADVRFEDDIVPILESKCWHCHGEDEQEGGLRLDSRAGLLRGGDSGIAAVVPGEPTRSYLLEVVEHRDPDVEMPPDDDPLPAEEIAQLREWIAAGAIWPGQMETVTTADTKHWSFQAVRRPDVPDGEASSPIDRFLARRLQEAKLDFSPPASARSLARRVAIVLTGLPPTTEELTAFLLDYEQDADKAYRALVDRLLDSPHFGERWAQHWLDVIRWAETNGSEANLYRKNAWVYRDYVVRAFNQDKPYDEFVREQLAGDSLGMGEATGFLVAGPHVPAATVGREPTAIRQARADRMDEIMQTVGPAILGLTIGCARCHNHKFDPLTIQDYYAMTAVFQDIEFGSRRPEYASHHPLHQRSQALWQQIHEQRDRLRAFGGWEENWQAFRELHFRPVSTKAVRIRFKTPKVSLDELEVLGPDGNDENFALAAGGTQLTGFPAQGNEGRNPIERISDGEYGTMAWRASVEATADKRPWVQLTFSEPKRIERLRLSSNREYFYDTDYLEQKPHLPRYEFDMDVLGEDGTWKPWVGTWHVNKKLTKDHPERGQVLADLQQRIGSLTAEGPRPSFVGRFRDPGTTHVLLRGSPESPRDEVPPRGPHSLRGELGLTSATSGPERRAAFATWITEVNHPLTARVIVNRIWHHVFGAGLVTTTSDFGTAGAAPSHPELLDWLAADFVMEADPSRPAWSIKSLIRQLVLTRAFRQASVPRADGVRKDAGTALLWRYPPKRVEAEVIRDTVLQASGSLDRTLGGQSYRIHNVKKTYAQWQVVDNHGPATWRRMLYQERMRRVDDQMFTAFDFPDCGQVRAKRPVSTTPLQALNLLNSSFVMDQSQKIAERALRISGGDDRTAVDMCFQLLLGRSPTEQELTAALPLADDLSLVCRAVLNTNEFAFLP